MKKLSIITICYNEPRLEETCKSIVNQTWQDFEWIVIDGGSNEETQKIWDKYKYRIDKFISEPDSGIYNAYNKGIKLADAEFLNFMNSGDTFYNEDVLKASSIFFDDNDNILYSNNECLYSNNHSQISNVPKQISLDYLIIQGICTQSVFYKRDLFDKYGLFDESYKILADYDKLINFAKCGIKLKCLPLIVASYDMNGISSYVKDKRYIIERESILDKYYTQKQIENMEKILNKRGKTQYSFLENIFSIKNASQGKHKVLTLLGIHIKIRRRSYDK